MLNSDLTERKCRRLLIIPARGGSKRIPGKNLVDVCGSPIIDYPVKTALSTNLFHEIVVSSDDNAILTHVRSLGRVSISLRPKELSGDSASVYSTLRHEYFLKKKAGVEFDEIWLFAATACLISKEDLIELSTAFEKSGSGAAMLVVTEYEVPVQWAMSIGQNGRLQSLNFSAQISRSQDLEKFYHDAGCLAVFPAAIFENHEEGVPEGEFEPFIMDRIKAVDIDYPSDLELVRALKSQQIGSL